MIPNKQPEWTEFYQDRVSKGIISHPYVAFKQVGNELEFLAGSDSYGEVLDSARKIDAPVYILWTRTTSEELYRQYGRISPRHGPPQNVCGIMIDI